jgi:hypothetical protein
MHHSQAAGLTTARSHKQHLCNITFSDSTCSASTASAAWSHDTTTSAAAEVAIFQGLSCKCAAPLSCCYQTNRYMAILSLLLPIVVQQVTTYHPCAAAAPAAAAAAAAVVM